jgi:hypothetical protein
MKDVVVASGTVIIFKFGANLGCPKRHKSMDYAKQVSFLFCNVSRVQKIQRKFGTCMGGSGHPSSSHKGVLGFLARLCVGFYVKKVLVFPRFCMFLGIGNGFSSNTYGTCLGSCKG